MIINLFISQLLLCIFSSNVNKFRQFKIFILYSTDPFVILKYPSLCLIICLNIINIDLIIPALFGYLHEVAFSTFYFKLCLSVSFVHIILSDFDYNIVNYCLTIEFLVFVKEM